MLRALVRAVVDTNILVRGILRRREAAAVAVFDALVRGDFRPLISDYILGEVRKTLREPPPSNCTFGGADRRTLHVTTLHALYEVPMRTPGLA